MWNWSHGNLEWTNKTSLWTEPKQWWQWNGWLIRTYDFLSGPQCSMRFCKLIELLLLITTLWHFHDIVLSWTAVCWPHVSTLQLPLRWLAVVWEMYSSIFRIKKWYKGRRIWTGQISGTENMPAWSRGPIEPCGRQLATQLSKKGRWNFQWKQLTNTWAHYLCVLWPHDSVEVKHVSSSLLGPPPSLPKNQPQPQIYYKQPKADD